ncbi:GGDEF domain-containing protein [Thiohalocapsa marina]|uniref:GGDEF domain-containing protein n=1 Tax=Thiohalocapsa marina TaxID=424902 RepID=A0A5M8FVT6_9GAMM|nr:GGDEF domain-containing protein [Thiohalocapsa marina]KAA6187873.1 GGDEF domain-containing protein [Thiohalocapsa marina]
MIPQSPKVAVRLHHKVRRLAFLVAALITSALAMLELATLVYEMPRDARSANATAARILGSYLSVSINDRVDDLARLAETALVSTALSDSRGRDAYLKPFFDQQNAAFQHYQLSLLDYRGRHVAGADFSEIEGGDAARALATETLESGRPTASALPAPDERLLVAIPVFFRYADGPIGILLGNIDIGSLLAAQPLDDLDDHSVRVLDGARSGVVLSADASAEPGYAPATFDMRHPGLPDLYHLTFEIANTSNPWLAPLVMRLLAWTPVLVFFIWLAWWLAGLMARRFSLRIEALAAVLNKPAPTRAADIPEDTTGDEIALLSECLRDSLMEGERANAELERLAHFDALTGLMNRTYFERDLAQALDRAKRHGYRLALLFIDLDRFKAVNDTAGHAAGDRVLELVGARLRRRVRASDLVSRLGGDEFTVLLEPCESPALAEQVGRSLVKAISQPCDLPGYLPGAGKVAGQVAGQVTVGASVGIAYYPEDGDTVEKLMGCADRAMYQVKDRGGSAGRPTDP